MTAGTETGAPLEEESDFSIRKIKIAFAIMIGTLFGSSILPFTAINLLTLPMTDEFGWTRTQFSGGLTSMMLVGSISAPFLGQLVDKIGVRRMIIGGTFVVGLITMALSQQDGSLWQYYAGFAILGFAGTTAIGYSKVIGALFNKHRGKALAIFGVESSIAGAFAPKLIQWLIDGYGWRGMFIGLGMIILAVIPVLLLWLKEPEAPKAPETLDDGTATASGLTAGEALASREFWFILIAGVIALAPAFGLAPHLIPYLVSKGVTVDTAVWMLSISMLAMAAGTVVGGFLMDQFDTAKVAAPFSLLTAIGLWFYLLLSGGATSFAFLLTATILIGFAGGAKRPMATVFQLRFFGLKSFATLVGIQAPFQAACMGISPLLVGMYFDKYGKYEPVFVVMAVLMAITFFLFWWLGPFRYAKNLTPIESQTPLGAMEGASAALKQEGR
ncbi:MAG: MFS transporter [Parvularculaceae bacterium]